MKTVPTFDLELSLKNQGYEYIIGVDEAGRGPLAGPVVAAAVYIPEGFDTTGINDSKKLSSKNRELFYYNIIRGCKYATFFIDEHMIDAINIREATKLAMRNVIRSMYKADAALIDGNFVPDMISVFAKPIIGGDSLSLSIAAASIVAKVQRDHYMEAMHQMYPIYGFNKHKGYGTEMHREAIKIYGPCPVHRKTFGGVSQYVKDN
jgi:ribonuclease HII